MKAILVIDMPETCEACPLTEWAGSYCRLVGMFCAEDERPSWCPLRELPEKYSQDHLSSFGGDYYTGYNHCLEDILGEENESTNNR